MNKKIVIISDTHGKHKLIPKNNLGTGDIIIHAGDITEQGEDYEIKAFLDWFAELPFEHKIFIAGNHDFWFEKNNIPNKYKEKNIHYLYENDIVIDNIKFFGTPWQPYFYNWAFNLERDGKEIEAKWNKIPNDTDILITHCPPFGILDTVKDDNMGCKLLLKKVLEIKPKIHIFGHNHNCYGKEQKDNILLINATMLNAKNYQVNNPVTIFFDTDTKVINYFNEETKKIEYYG